MISIVQRQTEKTTSDPINTFSKSYQCNFIHPLRNDSYVVA